MREENINHPYLGGNIEEVRAGEMDTINQQTGQPEHVTWKDAVKVTHLGRSSKMSGRAVIALVELYQENEGFRAWCEKC